MHCPLAARIKSAELLPGKPDLEQITKEVRLGRLKRKRLLIQVRNQAITLYLKLDPKEQSDFPRIARDVTDIGHYNTGDLEVSIASDQDFEGAKPLIEKT